MFLQQKLYAHRSCPLPNIIYTLCPSLYCRWKVLVLMQGHQSSGFHLILHVIVSSLFFITSFSLTPGSFSSAYKQALVCAIKKPSFFVSLFFSNFCILSLCLSWSFLKEFSFVTVSVSSLYMFSSTCSNQLLFSPVHRDRVCQGQQWPLCCQTSGHFLVLILMVTHWLFLEHLLHVTHNTTPLFPSTSLAAAKHIC